MGLLINGEYVDDAVIRQESAAMRPRYEELMQDMDPVAREIQLRDWSKENVIERVLLRQEAMRATEPVTVETIDEILKQRPPAEGCGELELRQQVEDQIRLEKLIAAVTEKAQAPHAKQMREFYKANQEAFATPPMAHASHIVKNVETPEAEAGALTAIQEAEKALQSGRPFAEVADEFSDCAGQGGTLGWFPAGEMVEEFEQVLFQLKPGEVSSIFRTGFGYHIAQLHELRPPGVKPFEEAKGMIEQTLTAQARERVLEEFVDGLRAKAEVRSAKQP